MLFLRALETDPKATRIFKNRLMKKAVKALMTNGSMTNRSMANDPISLIGACVTSLEPGDTTVGFKVGFLLE